MRPLLGRRRACAARMPERGVGTREAHRPRPQPQPAGGERLGYGQLDVQRAFLTFYLTNLLYFCYLFLILYLPSRPLQ